MANEIQTTGPGPGRTLYNTIYNRVGQVWNTSGGTGAFETFVSGNWSLYGVSSVEQGLSNFYTATFPPAIVPGVYSITARQQLGGSPVQTDPVTATGDYQWNGSVTLPLSDLATSGQLGQIAPIRLARGVAVSGFPLYLKSSEDHITPFTSGVVSGQISRDGGAFGAFQSGLVTEVGLGAYKVNMTSGDLLATTVMMMFTAAGVSGGTSDPLPMAMILQRTSGVQ